MRLIGCHVACLPRLAKDYVTLERDALRKQCRLSGTSGLIDLTNVTPDVAALAASSCCCA